MVAGRGMEVGQIMAVMQYITQILFSLSMLGFLLVNLVRARASALRVIEVLDVEPEIRSSPEARRDARITRGEVEFRDVTFRYPGAGGDPVLGGVHRQDAARIRKPNRATGCWALRRPAPTPVHRSGAGEELADTDT